MITQIDDTRKNKNISVIITVVVRYNYLKEYESWLEKTRIVLHKQQGFLGIEVIRPADKISPEYFILLRFNNTVDLEAWRLSKAFDEIKRQSKKFVMNVHRGEEQYGTEMFFSRPMNNFYYPKPPFWKQFIIGVLTVYPLILVSSTLLKPITNQLPGPLALFLSICLVSPLMIFAMPKVSKIFKNWLYPTKD